jgi:mono/diheme cytochrome c family protein
MVIVMSSQKALRHHPSPHRAPRRKKLWLKNSLLALFAIALIGIPAWFALRPAGRMDFAGGTRVDLAAYRAIDPTGAPGLGPQADIVARGEYLCRAGNCFTCHTVPEGKMLAGGVPFRLPFGTIYSTNLTPDQETGIGTWTDDDFVKAMHEGIGKAGQRLYPVFPYPSYTLLTRDDVLAIKAYLFSLSPVYFVVPANNVSFPYNQRNLLRIWNALFNPDERIRPNIGQTPEWNRGAYLVEALGHCDDCHTPRNFMMASDFRRKLGGAMIDGWKAYNISSDAEWGIGAWSEAQLMEYLSVGHAEKRSSAGGPMAEVLDDSLRFLVKDDIHSIASYLRTIPAVRDPRAPVAVPTPILPPPPPRAAVAVAAKDSLGLRVFEGACMGCHDFEGNGTTWTHATLVGNRSVNDATAVNAIRSILDGAKLETPHGSVFMPSFRNSYADAEIAAVANFITARFGVRTSALTADDVAKMRQ